MFLNDPCAFIDQVKTSLDLYECVCNLQVKNAIDHILMRVPVGQMSELMNIFSPVERVGFGAL